MDETFGSVRIADQTHMALRTRIARSNAALTEPRRALIHLALSISLKQRKCPQTVAATQAAQPSNKIA
jgi:hypothetical protein